MKRILRLFIFIVALSVVSACATQKKRSEASWIKKFYHNTTAYYNGYFNANILLNETIDNYNEQHQDNYNKMLDVYPYVDVENPSMDAPKLDKAIEKVSVVASLHPISYWVPDCYLMMAKCQYLKHDFETAEETLEYFKEAFKPGVARKSIAQVRKEVKQMEQQAKVEAKEKKVEEKEKKLDEKETAKKLKEKEKEDRVAARELAKETKEKERKQREKDRKKGKKPKVVGGEKLKTLPAPDTAAARKAAMPVINPIAAAKKEDKKEDKKELPKADKKEEKKEEETVAPIKPKAIDVNAKPEKYVFSHRPCYQEGMLWLARTYIERQRYENALDVLNQLEKNAGTFYDVRGGVATAEAHLFLKQKKYDMAVAPLRAAIEYSSKRREKARYHFILGQIFQQQNKGEEAYAAFERAYHYSNTYVMSFNAKLSLVQNAYLNGKATVEQVTSDLKKMLKEHKNEDYKDQIYFTLAQIAIKANDKTAAIENLRLSLANNKSNKQQKIESYLLLARLYFKDDLFVAAKNYYDSTLQVIAKTDESYDEVFRYANNLTDVAKNLIIIQEQDSLLRIASLSPKEKREIAAKIKQAREEEQRIATLAEATKAAPQAPTLGAALKRSNFFAYNPVAVRSGKQDFDKRWGADRRLEDNWRRSNRRSILSAADNPDGVAAADNAVADIDVSTIFKDVPDTPEKIASANEKVMNSMFALGSLYRERLKNNTKSAEILEKMLLRYPTTKYELDAWYFLYLTYTDLNNRGKAQEYYDKIVKKYPTTTYARILLDPNYLKDSQSEERKLNQYYEETYAMFQKGQFKAATERTFEVESLFANEKNTLRAKFALLRAMCAGSLNGKQAYIVALKEVTAKFADTPEQKRAKEIIRLLEGGDATTIPGLAKAADPEQTFLLEDNSVHYVLVVLGGANPAEKITDAQSSAFSVLCVVFFLLIFKS